MYKPITLQSYLFSTTFFKYNFPKRNHASTNHIMDSQVHTACRLYSQCVKVNVSKGYMDTKIVHYMVAHRTRDESLTQMVHSN